MNSIQSRIAKRYAHNIQNITIALFMILALYAVGCVDADVRQAENIAYNHR